MKLAESITNAGGITLMPAGIRLTPMFIARIKKWNIEELDVLVERKRETNSVRRPSGQAKQSPLAARGGAVDETLTAEQQEFARSVAVDVSRAFVNVKNNPLMMQLRAVAIKRLVMHGPNGIVNVIRSHQEEPQNGGTD